MYCPICNWRDKVTFPFAKSDYCPMCNPPGSKLQNNIANWISVSFNNIDVNRNVHKLIPNRELDIVVKDKQLAIEVNGLYFHNEFAGKDEHYHQFKTDECNKIGIQLIHIFEDEWYHKKSIVKSLITHKLQKTHNKIYARKCEVFELSDLQQKDFFENNFIDGCNNVAQQSFGLIYNDEIVYAISIKIQDNIAIICNFCSKQATHVIGGFSKLLHVLQTQLPDKIKSIQAQVDTRNYNGKTFEKFGFKQTSILPQQFWYTNRHQRFLTQPQDIENTTKIWGCKSIVYTLQL